MHEDWNYGWNDQFLAVNGNMDIMGYFNGSDLPYYYWLADKFAISDRYFCSVLGPTWPNRSFLYAATSFGIVETGQNISVEETPTIFDYFSDSGKNSFANPIRETLRSNSVAYPTNQPLWKYYSDAGGPSGECSPSVSGDYIQQLYPKKNYPCAGGSDQFVQDLKTGHLAPISFVDSNLGDDISLGSSEHPTSNVQEGQAFSAKVINALLASTGAGGYWWNTALFLTYDENGGFYDHVAPPAACTPDAYAPTGVTSPYGFDNYGFRVPLIVVSPYAKRHYVSHAIYDHTSILRFIETKFNLPALTRRDANAAPLNDLFDFTQTPQAPPGPAPQAQVIPCSKEPSLKIHRSPHCGDSSSISPSTTRSALISGSFGKLEKDS
jgi:phospholipase C